MLQKDIEDYGVLKLTKKGDAFLKKPSAFKIILNNLYEDAYEDDDEVVDSSSPASADPALFDMLKALRQQVAKEKKLPPFVIFLESSLEDMATQYPTSMEELEKISGVSKGKALRYGKQFIDLISQYVAENDVVKPDDFVMKSVVNKSSNKVFIIQQVDKKMPLETIAKSKDMRLEQLLEEMETIVASGTKLNLDYAIDQLVDEDDQQDILDYFKSCETSNLQVAQEELADLSLELEQLKIMRIKFLNVYGM
jgi:ATP-dependent DNA helicase RecQ